MTASYNLSLLGSNYNQGGTGAVARTTASKLQESVSVKDFGAVGDGSTNDSAAFTAANVALTALTNGGQLNVPSGTYVIGTNVTLSSNVRLVFATGAVLAISGGVTFTSPGQTITYGGTPYSGTGTFAALFGLICLTPGGSFGVGTLTPNVHAGDDGTTVRVISVEAQTSCVFIGQTLRTNSESGGPVGRSIVSFEGYRMANQSDSQESGAVRVITEGSSANQLGARVSVLTRRDGQANTDFNERWCVQNDGNVYQGGGPGGVGTANRTSQPYGNTVYTLSGQTGRCVFEYTTAVADADGTIIGEADWVGNFQTDEKRIAIIQGVLAGATATKRGGQLKFYLKQDNGALAERARITGYGFSTADPIGTLQTAPTLTITSNNITPVTPIAFLGAGLVKNLVVPTGFTSLGGTISIIPTAAFTTDVTGNIALASTATINRVMTFTYDGGTHLWYPSY